MNNIAQLSTPAPLPDWLDGVPELQLAPGEPAIEFSAEDQKLGYTKDPKVVAPFFRGLLQVLDSVEAEGKAPKQQGV